MEKKKKSVSERIAELKTKIVNCKDARQSEKLLNQLIALHKSTFEMNRLLDIPLSEIKETIDMGANVLYRTARGYVWECKGGMITFVEHKMAKVCTMLNTLFTLHNIEDKADDDKTMYEALSTAIGYIMECPIFSSLDERALFGNATAILHNYTEYCTEHYTNAEAPERTEDDYKEDAEFEQHAKAIEILAETPLPPEEIK